MPTTTPSELRTFARVIEVLGGPSATARLLNRTPQEVSQWRVRYGVFPAETYRLVQYALREKDLPPAALQVFRFD